MQFLYFVSLKMEKMNYRKRVPKIFYVGLLFSLCEFNRNPNMHPKLVHPGYLLPFDYHLLMEFFHLPQILVQNLW